MQAAAAQFHLAQQQQQQALQRQASGARPGPAGVQAAQLGGFQPLTAQQAALAAQLAAAQLAAQQQQQQQVRNGGRS